MDQAEDSTSKPLIRANGRELRRALKEEIYQALGLALDTRLRHLINPLVWAPTSSFARLAEKFDRIVADSGLPAAARQVLPRLISRLEVRGQASVPKQGPVLVAANHPGAADMLAIASSLPRDDVKVVVSDLPFFRGLPNAARHFIYTPILDSSQRMEVVRACIRHLREGGTLLIFPRGVVEPDPDHLPGAEESISDWSASLGVIARAVPQVEIVTAIVSGVLSRSSLNNPIARLRSQPRDRQRLAEFLQVIEQMVSPVWPAVSARVSFGRPMRAMSEDARSVTRQVIEDARRLLGKHMAAA